MPLNEYINDLHVMLEGLNLVSDPQLRHFGHLQKPLGHIKALEILEYINKNRNRAIAYNMYLNWGFYFRQQILEYGG